MHAWVWTDLLCPVCVHACSRIAVVQLLFRCSPACVPRARLSAPYLCCCMGARARCCARDQCCVLCAAVAAVAELLCGSDVLVFPALLADPALQQAFSTCSWQVCEPFPYHCYAEGPRLQAEPRYPSPTCVTLLCFGIAPSTPTQLVVQDSKTVFQVPPQWLRLERLYHPPSFPGKTACSL